MNSDTFHLELGYEKWYNYCVSTPRKIILNCMNISSKQLLHLISCLEPHSQQLSDAQHGLKHENESHPRWIQ